MANKKITELPFIDTISGSSVFDNPILNTVVPVVMYGTTNQITVENYAKFITLYSATTGSAGNIFTGPQTINNNVTINGRLRVHEIVAQFETSSILFSTGSTKLGDELTDRHEFTGSTNITGSVAIDGNLNLLSLRNYNSLFGTANSAITNFTVTVVAKSSNHRYFGVGSGLGYHIDGVEAPFLTLLPGKTYRFNQSDASNDTHQLLFYIDAARITQYITNVTTNGTAGTAGAYTQIVITDTTPIVLHYQCINHGYMGNSAQFNSNAASFNNLLDKPTLVSSSQQILDYNIFTPITSFNTTTASFNNVFLGIGSVTGALNTFTQSLNSLSGSYATTGSNTFIGNQNITGSLSISAGEFNVITGSGDVTSSLRFDHTQNDGLTLQLRNDDNGSFADSTFNVKVWAGGVYTNFIRNGTTYDILNVEAFDDNKIYLYRDTRLYNKSLTIDKELLVKQGAKITGSFSVTSGSGELTSSLAFTHNTISPTQGYSLFTLRHINNDFNENFALKLFADDYIAKIQYEQNSVTYDILRTNLAGDVHLTQDTRVFGKGLTVDDSLLVKGVITGSLLSTNGVVSSSNQLFELNGQTGSQNTINFNISVVTSSIDAHILGISTYTASVNTTNTSIDAHILAQSIQTASQDLVNLGISSVTGSLIGITNGLMAFTASLDNTFATDAQLYQLYQATASIQFATRSLNIQTGSQDLVNLGISTYTGSQNVINSSVDSHILKQATQTGSQDLVNLGISSVTGSLIGITNGLMAFTASIKAEIGGIEAYTASLKGAAIVSSSQQIQNYFTFAQTSSNNNFFGENTFTNKVTHTNGYIVLSQVSASLNFVDDTAAASSGVPLGGLYRNGNFIVIRIV